MRIFVFAKRNAKEILRDPINLFFGLAFPVVLLALFSLINANIPDEANNPMFAVENVAPGLTTFGAVFMALFSGVLLAKDRGSSFLMRLFASPMRATDFILGYTLPMLVFSATQSLVTLSVSVLLGLPLRAELLLCALVVTPVTFLFVGLGLLCGSLMNEKAVGGICGALLTNVAGWLSGIWIPLDLVGGAFKAVAQALPFYHAAESAKAALSGQMSALFPHLAVVLGYSLVIYLAAVFAFNQKMRGDKA